MSPSVLRPGGATVMSPSVPVHWEVQTETSPSFPSIRRCFVDAQFPIFFKKVRDSIKQEQWHCYKLAIKVRAVGRFPNSPSLACGRRSLWE